MLSQIIIVGIVTYLIYLLIYYYRYFTFWERQGIKTIPFISFGWALNPFHLWTRKNFFEKGKIYGAYSFSERLLVINDPKIVRDISIKEMHKFPIRFLGNNGTTSLVHSLFFMEANENWKRIRSIVSPTFTSGKLKGMLTPINRIVSNFIHHLEQFSKSGQKFDMKKYTSAFAMDVIASCAYGINVDSLNDPDHPIVANARKILSVDASIAVILNSAFPFFGKLFKVEPFNFEGCKYFDDLTFKIIEKRLENNKQNKDLIGLMIEQTNSSSGNDENQNEKQKLKGITREEISGQGIIFFLAGFDTTNVTFCHTIYNLILNPKWQDKLFDEIIEHESSLCDYEILRSLPILNAIINETLRLFPPLLLISRSTKYDTMLLDTGIKIPANTSLFIHPYVLHRNPEYFPDPDSFKPERFLGEKSEESNPAYIPFGVGPRLCVGMRFALNELRVAIANLVLHYELIPDPNLKLEYFNGNILLSPKELMCCIRKRVKNKN